MGTLIIDNASIGEIRPSVYFEVIYKLTSTTLFIILLEDTQRIDV